MFGAHRGDIDTIARLSHIVVLVDPYSGAMSALQNGEPRGEWIDHITYDPSVKSAGIL
ncbi:MAG: hypothetical protein JWP90_926 [Mycetocola sp.]|jgi:hypothetical protein|nr:hypothetical protein [Mycetocola sp.]